MKIRSGANINLMKVNVANIEDQKEDLPEQTQDTKTEAGTPEKQTDRITLSARPLNMMAGSFVHADGANDTDNYSLLNLNGMKSNQSLMTKFGSFMVNLIDNRMAFTDDLIKSGIAPIDAKYIAAAEFEKKGLDAHDKLGKEMEEEALEKEVEEIIEDIEERTEEVVEEKQEEKAVETKEAEENIQEKIEEKIAENSDQSAAGTNADEEVDSDSALVEGRPTGADTSSVAADNAPEAKGSGTGENVDTFV
ncbi:hypothetical protein [Maridesulfovibrio sp.]|uniref:hypothetical protein n=1 Tax=Maridesulfovibrio sp. TaxID=2795000 RepID=UPI002A1881BA|nr:hypothetical protein [Maridesulfovibrio sp.]